MYNFTLIGRVPSKKNSRITNRKTGRSFPSSSYVKWHKQAEKQLEKLKEENIDFPIHIHYEFFMPDLRKTDISNKIESINDLLVDIHFLKDDNWKIIQQFSAYAQLDRDNPRVEIQIDEL
ncbi:MAG: RusA family crossover junction endodeoxyribonuclease [Methanobrevibacter sp.]|nr:RusA family crossover junction endodeoxyribonuclease [Methanobrevibacter sp.]